MKINQLLSTMLSALVKIAIAIWIINFVYTKTMDAYDFGYRVFTEEAMAPAPGKDISVAITEGKSEMEIARMLEEKGLVRDRYLAFAQILASEYRKSLEPGAYILNTSMTMEEMMAAMATGHDVDEDEE